MGIDTGDYEKPWSRGALLVGTISTGRAGPSSALSNRSGARHREEKGVERMEAAVHYLAWPRKLVSTSELAVPHLAPCSPTWTWMAFSGHHDCQRTPVTTGRAGSPIG